MLRCRFGVWRRRVDGSYWQGASTCLFIYLWLCLYVLSVTATVFDLDRWFLAHKSISWSFPIGFLKFLNFWFWPFLRPFLSFFLRFISKFYKGLAGTFLDFLKFFFRKLVDLVEINSHFFQNFIFFIFSRSMAILSFYRFFWVFYYISLVNLSFAYWLHFSS